MVETCKAIYTALKDRSLKSLSTEDDWKAIAARFEEVWNFPHVFGVIDGKHSRIEYPKLEHYTLTIKGFLVWCF